MADDEYTIVIHPEQVELDLREKPPPFHNSDVWSCWIDTKPGGLQVFMHNRAKRAILRHASVNPNIEVGGVLIGDMYSYRSRANETACTILEITGGVRGDFTEGSSVSLTFTLNTWSKILRDVEAEYPDKRILGWYHTHPGHGIFLSGPDKFIQNNFFGHNHLLALVVDPIRKCGGFFVGSEDTPGGIQQAPQFIWDDALYPPQALPKHEDAPHHQQLQSRQDLPRSLAQTPATPANPAPYMGQTFERAAGDSLPEHRAGQQSSAPQRGGLITYFSSLLGRLRGHTERHDDRVPVSYEEAVLRINTGDLETPEVQRLLEQQDRTRINQGRHEIGYQGFSPFGCLLIGLFVPILFLISLRLIPDLLTPQSQVVQVDDSPFWLPLFVLGAAVYCLLLWLIIEGLNSSQRRD